MKKLFVACALTLSSLAFADQCQIVSAEQAARAQLLLRPGAEVLALCEPCGEAIARSRVSVVRNTNQVDYEGDKEIKINNKVVDLAYTFIKVAPNRFVNIAKVIGCPAEDVSDVISK